MLFSCNSNEFYVKEKTFIKNGPFWGRVQILGWTWNEYVQPLRFSNCAHEIVFRTTTTFSGTLKCDWEALKMGTTEAYVIGSVCSTEWESKKVGVRDDPSLSKGPFRYDANTITLFSKGTYYINYLRQYGFT